MDPVARLYAVPLEDFVAERKRVAREVRDGGDRDAAAELAKLPKPTPPAWALNFLARERPEVIGAWADVADALREASAAPGPGLREAMAAHRQATTQLVALARDEARPGGKRLSDPMLDRVRDLLQAATADAGLAADLRAGRVVERDDATLPVPIAPAREEPESGAVSKAARAAARKAAQQRAREAAERAGTLREAAADRAHAAAEAAERLEEAQRALLRAESEAEAAVEAAQEAREAATDAAKEAEVLASQVPDA